MLHNNTIRNLQEIDNQIDGLFYEAITNEAYAQVLRDCGVERV